VTPDVPARPLVRSDAGELHRLIAPEVPELRLDAHCVERNVFEDSDFAPELALGAFDGARLAGAAAGVLRHGTAYVKVLVVGPWARRRGLGTGLLRRLEAALHARGAREIQTDGAAPVYLLPGLSTRAESARRLFERHGYRAVELRSSMTVDLEASPLGVEREEARLGTEGYELRRAGPADGAFLLEEIARSFSPDWALEARFALRQAPSGLHLALRSGRLAAFAASRVWARNAFGPMGTAPEHEGRGLGSILLKRCLADLRASGEKQAVISWIGPEDFYARKVGAKRTLEYVVLRKPLYRE